MYIIRKAEISDSSELAKLAKNCFVETFGGLYSKENLEFHLNKTCSEKYFSEAFKVDQTLVAQSKMGNLIGYIKFGELGFEVDDKVANSVEIHRLYVLAKEHKKKIGTSLMNEALDHIYRSGVEALYLSVYEDNIIAQKFYRKYGFEKIGEYDYLVGSHVDREYIMFKSNN